MTPICWQHLKNMYMLGPYTLMLLCKLLRAKKGDKVMMETCLKEMKEIIKQLETLQISIPEDLIVLLMLQSLPNEYQYFIQMQNR